MILGEHLCPVCGKHTFSKYGSYEICPVCGWEDDSVQLKSPDFSGGANFESLNDFRKRWQEKQADYKTVLK